MGGRPPFQVGSNVGRIAETTLGVEPEFAVVSVKSAEAPHDENFPRGQIQIAAFQGKRRQLLVTREITEPVIRHVNGRVGPVKNFNLPIRGHFADDDVPDGINAVVLRPNGTANAQENDK